MSESSVGAKKDVETLVVDFAADPRPDLKDLIIVQCSAMVERIARRFSGIEPVDDLVQVGYIGLLNALSKFDPHAGVKFNTYATHLIAGEIKHYLRDRSQIIRHPAWIQELRQRIAKATLTLQAELGRQPTEREVAEACKISEQAIAEVNATQELLRVSSLDAPLQDDEEGDCDLDKLDASGSCSGQISVEDRVLLESAMQQLRDLEREVLVYFHFDSMSQTEIADKLGISCNYVSHILRQSLSKLRRILTSEEEADRSLRRRLPNDGEVMDEETKAYTEDYLKARLTEEIHRVVSSGSAVGVVVVQFTGLQGLQEFYGAASVRDFLADCVDFLRSSVRSLDVVCRYGDSGFAIILPGQGASTAMVRQRMNRRFSQWLIGRFAGSNAIEVQIGHASAPEHGRNASDLLRQASSDGTERQAA